MKVGTSRKHLPAVIEDLIRIIES